MDENSIIVTPKTIYKKNIKSLVDIIVLKYVIKEKEGHSKLI